MSTNNINRVVISGNLTADPELRSLPSGTHLCKLRVACNGRRKQGNDWVDKPNFFDITVWGAQGENAARYLKKGQGVAIDGRLDWREWKTQEGDKRQAVEIVADNVQFLSGNGGNNAPASATDSPSEDMVPESAEDFLGNSDGDDDGDEEIPF